MKHPFLAGLAGLGWRTGVLLLAVTAAAAMTFGTPEALKSALRDSGAYGAAADGLATQASNALSKGLGNGLGQAADKTAVETAAKQSITAESLQKAAEQNIDNTYVWLEGKTDKPDIKLDLSPYVNSFTQQVGDQALQKAKGLPACTAAQLRQIDPATINAGNLPCLPPGLDLNSAKDKAIQDATKSNDFLSNPVITADTLPKDANGKTAIDRAASFPTAYKWSMRAPWIFGALALLGAAALVFLWWPDWRQAARKLGRSLFFIGAILAVLAYAAGWLLSHFAKTGSGSKLAGDEFGAVTLAFFKSIEKTYDSKLLWFGLVYLVIGGVVWLAMRFLKSPTAVIGSGTVNSGPLKAAKVTLPAKK